MRNQEDVRKNRKTGGSVRELDGINSLPGCSANPEEFELGPNLPDIFVPREASPVAGRGCVRKFSQRERCRVLPPAEVPRHRDARPTYPSAPSSAEGSRFTEEILLPRVPASVCRCFQRRKLRGDLMPFEQLSSRIVWPGEHTPSPVPVSPCVLRGCKLPRCKTCVGNDKQIAQGGARR